MKSKLNKIILSGAIAGLGLTNPVFSAIGNKSSEEILKETIEQEETVDWFYLQLAYQDTKKELKKLGSNILKNGELENTLKELSELIINDNPEGLRDNDTQMTCHTSNKKFRYLGSHDGGEMVLYLIGNSISYCDKDKKGFGKGDYIGINTFNGANNIFYTINIAPNKQFFSQDHFGKAILAGSELDFNSGLLLLARDSLKSTFEGKGGSITYE